MNCHESRPCSREELQEEGFRETCTATVRVLVSGHGAEIQVQPPQAGDSPEQLCPELQGPVVTFNSSIWIGPRHDTLSEKGGGLGRLQGISINK